MPRLVFDETKEFNGWLESWADPERYAIVSTKQNEVIAYPRRSTEPITYGLFTFAAEDGQSEFLKDLKSKNYRITHVHHIDWDTRRGLEQ